MYTQDELVKRSAPYVEQWGEILVTDDAQFFRNNPDGLVFANNYAFKHKMKVYLVTKKGIGKVLDNVEPEVEDKDEVEKKAAAKAAKEAEKKAADEVKEKAVKPGGAAPARGAK